MKTLKKIITLSFFLLEILSVKGQSITSIDLHAYKLLYDIKRDKIYATVKSLDPNYGNSFVQINPYTGLIENSIFVGSEPSCMDITKDTNYVYIGLDGASFVKRIDLNSFEIDQTISLGTGSSGPTFAKEVATVNLSPDLIVIARKRTNVSPQHDGVVAYFKGVKLSGETPHHTGSTRITSANDTNLVFGYNDESTESGFRRMQVDTTIGVTLIDVNQMSMGGNRPIQYEQGLVYSSGGHIIDPYLSTPTFLGTYANISWNFQVEPDAENDKTFFSYISNGLKIRRYNLQTMTLLNEITINNAYPNNFQLPKTSDIIRYGERGLAIIVHEDYFDNQDRRVVLYESCAVKDGADLQITTELSDTQVNENDTLDLKIVVSNVGGSTAEFVTITDTLNNVFDVVSIAVSSGNAQIYDNIIEWEIDSIASNQSDTVNIKIHFSQQGIFENKIYATSNTFDCNSLDNILVETILVENVLLSSTIQVNNFEPSFFPNPVIDDLNLYFSLKESDEIQLSVTDIKGNKVFEEKWLGTIGENHKIIDMKHLNNGLYFFNIQTNNGLNRNFKVIKM